MIFYLIYLSSAKQLFTNSDLSDILSRSRLNNTSKDTTGLLLYHEGSILQVLEGDEETVMSLYYKIHEDNRHHRIMKMVAGVSDERNFPDWSIRFKTVTNAEWDELSGYLRMDSSGFVSKLKHINRKISTLVNSYMTVNFR